MMRMSVHILCLVKLNPEIEDHRVGGCAFGGRGNLSGSLVQEAKRKRDLGWGSPFVIYLGLWFLTRVVQGLSAMSGNILVVTTG